MRILRNITRWTTTLLVGVVVLTAVAAGVLAWAGYRPLPVMSGSMDPLMPVGSMIMVERIPASSVAVGDVITFQRPGSRDMLTHRVVGIDRARGFPVYTTKGDANPTEDPFALRLPGSVGRHVATVPYLGTAATAVAQPDVRAATIALLTLLLMAAAVRSIWRRDESDACSPVAQAR